MNTWKKLFPEIAYAYGIIKDHDKGQFLAGVFFFTHTLEPYHDGIHRGLFRTKRQAQEAKVAVFGKGRGSRVVKLEVRITKAKHEKKT